VNLKKLINGTEHTHTSCVGVQNSHSKNGKFSYGKSTPSINLLLIACFLKKRKVQLHRVELNFFHLRKMQFNCIEWLVYAYFIREVQLILEYHLLLTCFLRKCNTYRKLVEIILVSRKNNLLKTDL
jgi:hypothetical protein